MLSGYFTNKAGSLIELTLGLLSDSALGYTRLVTDPNQQLPAYNLDLYWEKMLDLHAM